MHRQSIISILTLLLSISSSASSLNPYQNCTHESVIIKKLMKQHDKRKVPGSPVEVRVEIWVQEVSRLLEVTSEFELDVYGNDIWMDKTLAYAEYNPCKGAIFLIAEKFLPKIWYPNSCFVNSKNASIHQSPYPNTVLILYKNGTVWFNYRIKLTAPCVKDLKTFPIDHQKCILTYESYHHNNDNVRLLWNYTPVSIYGNVKLPDYRLETWVNLISIQFAQFETKKKLKLHNIEFVQQ